MNTRDEYLRKGFYAETTSTTRNNLNSQRGSITPQGSSTPASALSLTEVHFLHQLFVNRPLPPPPLSPPPASSHPPCNFSMYSKTLTYFSLISSTSNGLTTPPLPSSFEIRLRSSSSSSAFRLSKKGFCLRSSSGTVICGGLELAWVAMA